MNIKRGDIFWANIGMLPDSNIIHGRRPVIVISNNNANIFSPIITVLPLTCRDKKPLSTHVLITGFGLRYPSTVLTEQVLTIDKSILQQKISSIAKTDTMKQIEACLCQQLDVA
jgi:mRNA-degrading endonuclease toxin of MazEF toxin-antitoxin module